MIKNSLLGIIVVLSLLSLEIESKKSSLKASDFSGLINLFKEEPKKSSEITCDEAIDNFIFNTDIGGLIFIIINSAYLGQWSDYGTCLGDIEGNQGQYVLAKVSGEFQGDYTYTRGAQGKYMEDFGAFVGLCVPSQCTKEDMGRYNKSIMQSAIRANWTNVSIEYIMSSHDVRHVYPQTISSTMTYITIGILLLAVSLGTIGTIIELTKLGDVAQINYQRLDEEAKFKNVDQYDAILLQRKRKWSQVMLCFSYIRNIFQFAVPQMPLKISKSQEQNKDITKNLAIFNGLKGIGMMYMVYGLTYYFAWYSVIENPYDIKKMKENFFFTLITGSIVVVPLFFFMAGFLQTYSFMLKGDSEMFTVKTLLKYYFKKLVRYAPFNMFMVLFFTYLVPLLGTGPIWHGYYKTIEPCQTYWWTQLFYINNFYPQNYDDKCMPWSWFLAAYIQLSLLLPLILVIYKKNSLSFTITIYSIIANVIYVLNFGFVYIKDVGALPIDDEFHAQIFMKPWYHFNSYFLGIVMCLLYKKYLDERQSDEQKSKTSRLLSFIKENAKIRWLCYFTGIFLMSLTTFGQYPLIQEENNSSLITQAFYASFAYQAYLFGLSLILMPALLGKAQFFRWFFSGGIWCFLGQFSFVMYHCAPLMCLLFYFSAAHSIYIAHHMMFYLFIGNYFFGLNVGLTVGNLIDRPIYALFYLRQDVNLVKARKNREFPSFIEIMTDRVMRFANKPLNLVDHKENE